MRVKFSNCLVQQLFQVLYIAIVDLDLDRGGGNNTISRVVEWEVQIAEVKQEKRKINFFAFLSKSVDTQQTNNINQIEEWEERARECNKIFLLKNIYTGCAGGSL